MSESGRLDLRAVEFEARSQLRVDAPTVLALLAHCRALRGALHEMLDTNYQWSPTREGERTRSTRARAVLESAVAAAGAAPEETHP